MIGSNLLQENLEQVMEINGIKVFNIKSNRFKTNSINFFFEDNLDINSVTLNALFPSVLRRGCKRLPTMKDINLYLEKLYGAIFDCGIIKKGEKQILHFNFEYVSPKYTFSDSGTFEKALTFLIDIIYSPVLQEESFNKLYVEQEKNNLKTLIESRLNDKVQYAIDRCLELMCKDEPFGIFEYGSISQLQNITADVLYKHYLKKVESLPLNIFITGELTEEDIAFIKSSLEKINRSSLQALTTGVVKKFVDKVSNYEDLMDVNQAKLSLAFRTGVTSTDSEYYALMVYNGILGAGMHSKLFQNVREKAGLAYYVFVGLDKFKGLMFIGSGIDAKERENAEKLILKQLEDIAEGNISDYEFDSTIKYLETGINSLKDSQLQVVDFHLSQLLSGTQDTLENLIEKIKRVSKEEVIAIAKKIQLDTIYYLAPK